MRQHDPSDVERQILGSLLVDPSGLDKVGGSLTAGDMASTWHAQVLNVVRAVYEQGGPPEALPGAVIRNLVTDSRLPRADVSRDISALMSDVGALTTLEHDVDTMARLAQVRRILHESRKLSGLASGADIEAIRESIKALGDLALGVESPQAVPLATAAHGHAERLRRLETHEAACYKTGLPVFDNTINKSTGGGIQGGQLGLIGGRTASGKTTLASFVALQVAARHPSARIHFFSLELDPRVLAAKAIARQISADGIQGTDSQKAKAAADALSRDIGKRITISEEVCPAKILAHAHRLARDGVDFFVLDHIHRVRVSDMGNIRHELGDFTIACRDHAKRWDVPWILAAQLSRESVRKATAPGLEDVAESDKIVREADWCVTIWYPDMEKRAQVELRVCKNRTGPEASHLTRVLWEAQSFTRIG